MINFPTTIIYRHKKENKKKCTLEPLVSNPNYTFFSYPTSKLPLLENYFILSLDAPCISEKDQNMGCILIDGTWNYASKMLKALDQQQNLPKRSIPTFFETAYPRKQTDCTDPTRGLASIEALYIANIMLGRPTEGLLESYHWKDTFLQKNKDHFIAIGQRF